MAVQNKCNITTLITGNHREKLPNNRKSAIYSIDGQDGNMVCIGQTRRLERKLILHWTNTQEILLHQW